ncbi:putative ADP-ribosylation factor GTPase-activating protein agd15-like [Stylosanthes scabra]|uniref:ADP-ribosylation factor GTPase-activating protein agd15-like n=1 Tax=Stylosanthes scabra TaxID=79078 RepID=A0ABU6RSC3_9FABA|nr:putative ADP-ribosylation factor GTPase-activating protein agd15-like [Stylosanthes scabra]
MGNEKSNKHWEAKLPPNFDRSTMGMEKFIYSKYVEKKWTSKEGLITGTTGAPDNFFKNTNRRLSLEESILSKHVAHVLSPFTGAHQGSLVMQKKSSAPPLIKRPSSSVDFDKFIGKRNGSADFFSLLCVQEDKQGCSTWTTFDLNNPIGRCKVVQYVGKVVDGQWLSWIHYLKAVRLYVE